MVGMTAVICTYPLDVIRACLAYQMKGHHRYTGIRNAFQTMYLKEGGIPGFYKGLIPTLIGMTPYAGFLFITRDTGTTVLRQPRGAGAVDPRQPALWKGWPELSTDHISTPLLHLLSQLSSRCCLEKDAVRSGAS
ncbi:graves disease carrier protein-like [Oncorhynchus kisutch]|uniref:graves disease carrier protein-like n=1 Tax=Oncorhynchus kisutch TaxID=8019 RepID=UPI0012DCC090|nr:graves disease carrier protein-like [Oncorhynchus kisutch]